MRQTLDDLLRLPKNPKQEELAGLPDQPGPENPLFMVRSRHISTPLGLLNRGEKVTRKMLGPGASVAGLLKQRSISPVDRKLAQEYAERYLVEPAIPIQPAQPGVPVQLSKLEPRALLDAPRRETEESGLPRTTPGDFGDPSPLWSDTQKE